jgi:hypothetical protein
MPKFRIIDKGTLEYIAVVNLNDDEVEDYAASSGEQGYYLVEVE